MQLRLTDIRADVFANVLPALSPEEYRRLEQSIVTEGCHDALTVWTRGSEHILVDGHNRWYILTKHGHTCAPVRKQDFPDEDAARLWIFQNQLGRRNLARHQKAYWDGWRYDQEVMPHGGDRKSSSQNDNLTGRTAERLERELGIPAQTILNHRKYYRAINAIGQVAPAVRDDLLAANPEIELSQRDTIRIGDMLQSPEEHETGLMVLDKLAAHEIDGTTAFRWVRQEQRGQTINLLVSIADIDELVAALQARNGAGSDGALLARLLRLQERYQIRA